MFKITIIIIIIMNMHWKQQMECIGLEVFGPDMSCQTEASTSGQQRRSRGGLGHKGRVCFLASEWFLFSCAKTEGDRWVVYNVVFLLCHCASSWWFSVNAFLCVCRSVFVIRVLLHHSRLVRPSDRPSVRPSSRPAESSSPELRCVHLPTGGAGGAPLIMAEEQREKQESLQVSAS